MTKKKKNLPVTAITTYNANSTKPLYYTKYGCLKKKNNTIGWTKLHVAHYEDEQTVLQTYQNVMTVIVIDQMGSLHYESTKYYNISLKKFNVN